MAQNAHPLRRWEEEEPSQDVVDGVVAGGTRATVFATLRAMMISKLRTSFRVLAFKSFNPAKMSSFAQLQDQAKKSKPWWENIRHIVQTEGWRGIHHRTMPVLLGNYLNSMVLFSTYSKLCDVPLNVHDDALLMGADSSSAQSSKEQQLRQVVRAGAISGGLHGIVAASTHVYIEKLNRERLTHRQLPSILPLFRTAKVQSTIAQMTLVDASAFAVFFGAFELGKQLWLPPIKSWVSRQSWIADQELATVSCTALAAGGAAGLGHTVVKFPCKWVVDGKHVSSLASTAFGKELVSSTLKSLGPNAVTFLVLEVLLYKSGLHSM